VRDADHMAPHEWQWRERALSQIGDSASASPSSLAHLGQRETGVSSPRSGGGAGATGGGGSASAGKRHVRSWPVDRICEVHFMRYLLQNIAVMTTPRTAVFVPISITW
jgi:hypothetical protein